ncbi:hypothetical protein THASP1DRAFT_11644, partial [Thamnocephalis sphaerospora]
PFILPGALCMDEWPACKRWHDARYLLRVLGRRWVPVELGQRYTDAAWRQQLMRFDAFLDAHVVPTDDASQSPAQVGYLAQHDLFYQVPQLRRDILVPDYCYAAAVQTHAWLGPAGTISPLHHDPDRNLFAQVVGRKFLRLYAPDAPVYAHSADSLLHNTSQVDVLAPDLVRFPDMIHAQAYDCLLMPGDLLYIPASSRVYAVNVCVLIPWIMQPRWWRYVHAVDVSFSVSFWF